VEARCLVHSMPTQAAIMTAIISSSMRGKSGSIASK
jgi:hypothetical protein